MRFFPLFKNILKGRAAMATSLRFELAKFNKIRSMSTKAYGNDEVKTARSEYDTTMTPPEGWTMNESGSIVELHNITSEKEKICVKFDIQENYDINRDEIDDSTQRYPLVYVTFEKKDRPKLELKCIFDPDANDWDLGMIQLKNGTCVIISSFTVTNGNNIHSCSEDFADPEILMRLSDYMIQRGLDANFFQQIVEISDNHDLKSYSNLLMDLRDFVKDSN